jgi:hypothetical protein
MKCSMYSHAVLIIKPDGMRLKRVVESDRQREGGHICHCARFEVRRNTELFLLALLSGFQVAGAGASGRGKVSMKGMPTCL